MPKNYTTEPDDYSYATNFARMLLLIIFVFVIYGDYIPYVPIASYALNFVPGALFALYGYTILLEANDLKKNIKHAFFTFLIMVAVFLLSNMVLFGFLYGAPFTFITKRTVFNFLVLNFWTLDLGTHIWMVQSTLYALVILYFLRNIGLLYRFYLPIMLFCFLLTVITGEGAGLVHLNVYGYSYFPGNFLTRTLPYMLLGMWYRRYVYFHGDMSLGGGIVMMLLGIILCYGELFQLSLMGALGYTGHLIGFIPMTVGLLTIIKFQPSFGRALHPITKFGYKCFYFLYNPVAEVMMLLATLTIKSASVAQGFLYAYPFLIVLVTMLSSFVIIKMIGWSKSFVQEAKQLEEDDEYFD